MAKLLTEIIGTFFLVLVIGMTGQPLAIGLALATMVYLGGHVSGAHYNPAVTLAFFMRRDMGLGETLGYIVGQLVGASMATLLVWYLTGSAFAPAPSADATFYQALVAEAIFTFALLMVIFNVAVSESTKGNQYYGLAIGLTIFFAASSVGSLSGGAFNPAVGVGPILVSNVLGDGGLQNLLLYIGGPVIGSLLAVIAFKYQQAD